MAALEVDAHPHDYIAALLCGRSVGMWCRRARPLGKVGLRRVVFSEDGRNFVTEIETAPLVLHRCSPPGEHVAVQHILRTAQGHALEHTHNRGRVH